MEVGGGRNAAAAVLSWWRVAAVIGVVLSCYVYSGKKKWNTRLSKGPALKQN